MKRIGLASPRDFKATNNSPPGTSNCVLTVQEYISNSVILNNDDLISNPNNARNQAAAARR